MTCRITLRSFSSAGFKVGSIFRDIQPQHTSRLRPHVPISDPKVHKLLVSSKLPKHQLRAALPHLGEPKFPRTGIDVSNTAAVIIAIELLARLMIMKLKCPYDVTIVFDIAYFVKAEA